MIFYFKKRIEKFEMKEIFSKSNDTFVELKSIKTIFF